MKRVDTPTEPQRLIDWFACIAYGLKLCLALTIGLSYAVLHAEEPLQPLSGFVHRAWTARTGAPGDISDFAQTNDGMVWIASASGLFQFDGVRFAQVQGKPGGSLSLDSVYSVYAPPTGGLWVGLRYGGLVFINEGEMTEYPPSDVVPDATVHALAQDRAGALWAATAMGLLRFQSGGWERIGEAWGLSPGNIAALFVDRSGAVWVCTKNELYVLNDGARQFTKEPVRLPTAFAIRHGGMADAPDGTLWVADAAKGKVPSRGSRTMVMPEATSVQFDKDGSLWYSSGDDVRRITNMREFAEGKAPAIIERFSRSDGLLGDVIVLAMDREGNIWVGSDEGIDIFVPTRLRMVRQASAEFAMTAGQDGSMWWTETDDNTARWTVNHYMRDGVIEQLVAAESLTTAYTGDDGTLWFGGQDVWRFDGKQLISLPPLKDVRSFGTQALVSGRDGSLWRSVVRAGVFRYSAGDWQRNGGLAGLPQEPAIVMKGDERGRLWFGYTNNRLALIDGNSVTMLGPSDGVNVGNVTAIDARGQHVWIGGAHGLLRFDGHRFMPVHVRGESPYENLWGVVETRAGELWAAGGRSLIRLNVTQLKEILADRVPKEPPQLFDYRDGVVGPIQYLRPLPALVEAGEGRIWFALTNGLGFVNPGDIARQTTAPFVSIQTVNAGGRDYSPYLSEIRLPTNTSQLRIGYTAVSFAAPERIRFRYKLEGLDTDWQDVGEQREAVYTNLGPGHYRFEFEAANRDSPWSAPSSSIKIMIPPAFYQTQWFYGAVALAAIWVLSLLYRLRMRQISLQVQSRLEERITERERIARELHDTLLQGFHGLMLHLQAVAIRVKNEPVNAHELIEQTLKRADTVLEEGRDRVKDLRATDLAPTDLSEIFLSVPDNVDNHGAKVQVTVEGKSRELHPIVREEVERIGIEAIANALRHANASVIEVEIVFHRKRFELHVYDDGIGINSAVLDDGRDRHFGLRGMRERAKKIRATLLIASGANNGTEIELTVPASVAFVPHGRISRLRRSGRIV